VLGVHDGNEPAASLIANVVIYWLNAKKAMQEVKLLRRFFCIWYLMKAFGRPNYKPFVLSSL